MNRLLLTSIAVATFGVACASAPPTTSVEPGAEVSAQIPDESAGEVAADPLPSGTPGPSATDGECTLASEATERITIANAGGYHFSASGLGVRFDGVSHDNYADGTTDVLFELTLWNESGSERWMPSGLAIPPARSVLDHCVQIVQSDDGGLALDVAPSAAIGELEACNDDDATTIESYAELSRGDNHILAVARDPNSGAWVPQPALRQLRHHADRLDWQNLTSYPALAVARDQTLMFRFTVENHTVRQRKTHKVWMNEFEVGVESVCVAGIDTP